MPFLYAIKQFTPFLPQDEHKVNCPEHGLLGWIIVSVLDYNRKYNRKYQYLTDVDDWAA